VGEQKSIITAQQCYLVVLIADTVPIKLIFFSKLALLLGTCSYIFNFDIVKHAKITDFLGTCRHIKIIVGTLIAAK